MPKIILDAVKPGIIARVLGKRSPPGIVRLRIWFDKAEDIEPGLRAVLPVLVPSGRITLDFWYASPSVLQALRDCGVDAAPPLVDHPVSFDLPLDSALAIAKRMEFAPFGAWIGLRPQLLAELLRLDHDRDRFDQMPDGSAMLVFSLYDRNLEIAAKAAEESNLGKAIEEAASRAGITVVRQ